MTEHDSISKLILFDPDQLDFTGMHSPYLFPTSTSCIHQWKKLMEYIPTIAFPEPEGHWSYKWRMFKKRLKELPSNIRWRLFPYHVIHKDDYEEMFEE